METKDRLERVATVLSAAECSPSVELREMGERLLENEIRDLERSIRLEEAREAEEFHSLGTPQCSVSRICRESVERVRRIMGRE